jgi:hypothetical protein
LSQCSGLISKAQNIQEYIAACLAMIIYKQLSFAVLIYVVVSKIFRTDAGKIIKFTIRPIGHHHPRSSSLPHVDTSPTVSSIFGMLPGNPFLSDQALSMIRLGSPQYFQTSVLSASFHFRKKS